MTGFLTDENGPYYWHVKSGNIQREPPEAPPHSKRESRRSLIKDNDSVSENFEIETRRMDFDALRHFHDSMMQINNFHTLSGMVNTVTRSNTSSALDQELENKRKVELALKWDTLSIYLIVSNFSSMQRFTLCFFYFFSGEEAIPHERTPRAGTNLSDSPYVPSGGPKSRRKIWRLKEAARPSTNVS